MTISEKITLFGNATYSKTFSRYCSARRERDRLNVEVRMLRNDGTARLWATGRLEHQRLCKRAKDLQLTVQPMSPDLIDEFYNPRREPDARFGTIVAFHRRYDFNETKLKSDSFDSWSDLRRFLEDPEPGMPGWDYKVKVVSISPLYMLDHSGFRFSTKDFECPWDSGLIGYIFATEEDIKNWNPGSEEEIVNALKGAVEVWDKWHNGELWEYLISVGPPVDGQIVDSADGMFSEDEARELGESMFDGFRDAFRREASVSNPNNGK